MPEQLNTIVENLKGLGARRLAIMGGVVALVISVITVGAIYLNRPAYETLYVGLERSDVNQIGLVLSESGIRYDVGSDGTTVKVPVGQTAQARMLLAEKGLPSSTDAGYELFDNIGSLGLTTFMQEVTRVRALEGEISRTIRTMKGIKAARVHLVMPERGNFRREAQSPSASVVIRTSSMGAAEKASAMRHLVAAAVPGLKPQDVTVLDSAGSLLASGDDPANNTAQRSMGIERTVEGQIEENIRQALSPYLGPENFRASVKADVNTDSRQIEEVSYDPDSKVERSVQVVRTNDSASKETAANPATVLQNLPEEEAEPSEMPRSTEESERREETINYELNTKRVSTTSNGYQVTGLSMAVVVNEARLASSLGANPSPDQLQAQIDEIRSVVASATGFDEVRGDVLTVSAVDFMQGLDGAEVSQPGVLDTLSRHTGTLINAAAFILVAFLVTWFGLKPLGAALTRTATAETAQLEGADQPSLPNHAGEKLPSAESTGSDTLEESEDAQKDLKVKPAPQDRLARMVDLSEERTAHILRKWASGEAEAAG